MKLNIKSLTNCVIACLLLSSTALYSQKKEEPKKTNKPVKATFENAVQINNQSVINPNKKTLDVIIQHRFGVIKNEKDMFGLFAPSNIRIGFNYGLTNRLAIGIGATKNKHLYDLQWKYIILKQTAPKGIPVSVAYYGDFARSAAEQSNFINQEGVFKATNRISYFHEIMVARKIGNKISLQLAGTYSYFNIIDSLMEHQNLGASFLGKYKFSPQSSIMLDFDFPITSPLVNKPKPNLGFGYEVSTSGHQFQIFVSTCDAISNQHNRVFNQNDFMKKELLIGFNITRQWGF